MALNFFDLQKTGFFMGKMFPVATGSTHFCFVFFVLHSYNGSVSLGATEESAIDCDAGHYVRRTNEDVG